VRYPQAGQVKLSAKASQVYGKPGKGDLTGWYVNQRDGSVQSVVYRMPETKKVKMVDGVTAPAEETTEAKQRPDVTQT
jgi:ParB family chromosome partitioning protein